MNIALLRTFFIVFRVKIKQGEKILTDSGNIYNTLLTGGRLGMFVYGQHDVIWSRLEARCSDRYCWFSHDVTKIQTKKLSILLRFYFHGVLEQLKTNFQTNFASEGFLVL